MPSSGTAGPHGNSDFASSRSGSSCFPRAAPLRSPRQRTGLPMPPHHRQRCFRFFRCHSSHHNGCEVAPSTFPNHVPPPAAPTDVALTPATPFSTSRLQTAPPPRVSHVLLSPPGRPDELLIILSNLVSVSVFHLLCRLRRNRALSCAPGTHASLFKTFLPRCNLLADHV